MRKTVRKWIWAWEFEKEEKWLDEMSAQGWALDKVGFCRYEFVQCEPNEYVTRLEMLEEHVDSAKSREYIEFVESTGAEYIGHVVKWVYFRKKAADGGFDLYSDIDSRIKHVQRIIRLLAPLLCINLLNSINMVNLTASESIVLKLLSVLVVAAEVLLAIGLIKLNGIKKRLEAERQLHE
jgi:hypothetical protein